MNPFKRVIELFAVIIGCLGGAVKFVGVLLLILTIRAIPVAIGLFILWKIFA